MKLTGLNNRIEACIGQQIKAQCCVEIPHLRHQRPLLLGERKQQQQRSQSPPQNVILPAADCCVLLRLSRTLEREVL